MLALAEVEAGECPSCRGDLAVTTDGSTDGRWTPTHTTCHRCKAINIYAEKKSQDRHGNALLFGASLRD